MYVKHTFLSKTNTIVRGEKENLSLNPIMELSYGGISTRGILFFDTNELKALHEDKTYPVIKKLKHRLKMFNTGSIQHKGINKCFPDQKRYENRERAVSFDLIFFKIPMGWDSGRGFDYTQDIYFGKHRGYNEYGSNWFNCATNTPWETYNYVNLYPEINSLKFNSNNTFYSLESSPIDHPEIPENPDSFVVIETVNNDGRKYSFYTRVEIEENTLEYVLINQNTAEIVYSDAETFTPETNPYYEAENMENPENYVVKSEIIDEDTEQVDYTTYYFFKRELLSTPGVYSTDKLDYELDKFKEGHSEIILATQHFDYGNESIDIDITNFVNNLIEENEQNFGIGIAFAPCFERMCVKPTQYVGFFTCHTNSFFEPYIETIYYDRIIDDRANFYLDKTNRLYLHSIIGGKHANLDDKPSCTINDTQYPVEQAGKGLYYVVVDNFTSDNYEPVTMFYDTWSNITYNNRALPDVEKFFTTKKPEGYYNFGLDTTDSEYKKIVPNIYGINNGEKLHRENLIMVNIEYIIKHTKKQEPAIYDSEYRLYTKQGEKEITVIDWQSVHCDYIKSYFFLDTKSLLPSKYFVDIKCHDDFEETVFKKKLEFYIVDDATEIEA